MGESFLGDGSPHVGPFVAGLPPWSAKQGGRIRPPVPDLDGPASLVDRGRRYVPAGSASDSSVPRCTLRHRGHADATSDAGTAGPHR